MPRYVVSLSVELSLIDIVLELDEFDPKTNAQTVLDYWLTTKDPKIIEAVETLEVMHSRCLDDQPHYDPFSASNNQTDDQGNTAPVTGLYESNIEKTEQYQQTCTQSKEVATEALQKAGILDKQGEPAKPYKELLGPYSKTEDDIEELNWK